MTTPTSRTSVSFRLRNVFARGGDYHCRSRPSVERSPGSGGHSRQHERSRCCDTLGVELLNLEVDTCGSETGADSPHGGWHGRWDGAEQRPPWLSPCPPPHSARRSGGRGARTGGPVPAPPPPPANPLVFPNPFAPPPPPAPPGRRPQTLSRSCPVSRRRSPRHPGRAEPHTVRRTAAVRAAVVQPDQRIHGRRRQADLHQLPAAHRQPADGPGRGPHLVQPAGARQVLLDHRHPAALASPGLLAGRHGRQHRRRRVRSRVSPCPSNWSPRSTTRHHQMEIMRNGELEKTFPMSMGKRATTPRTAPTTCWRSSPTS